MAKEEWRLAAGKRACMEVLPAAAALGANGSPQTCGPSRVLASTTGCAELGNDPGKSTRSAAVVSHLSWRLDQIFVQHEMEQTLEEVAATLGGSTPEQLNAARMKLRETYKGAEKVKSAAARRRRVAYSTGGAGPGPGDPGGSRAEGESGRAGADEAKYRPSDITVSQWPFGGSSARGSSRSAPTLAPVVCDVTVVSPTSQKAMTAGAAEAAVAAALGEEEKRQGAAEAVEILGARFLGLAVSVNGNPSPAMRQFLEVIAKRWAVVAGFPEHVARWCVVRDFSVMLQRANAKILRKCAGKYANGGVAAAAAAERSGGVPAVWAGAGLRFSGESVV